ncbi:MAG: hypothetical protein QM713_07565 [Arachnia sp.]
MTEPKDIATLPPLEELQPGVERSPRTGEPRRPVVVGIAAALTYLAAAAVAVAYGAHWWDAAHPETYPSSARLISWVKPDPGKWLSLTLEGVLAAAAVLAAGAPAVSAFQAWNGWRWSRWAGLIGIALTGGFLAITSTWALPALALAVVGAALLWLPPVARYLADWDRVRAERPVPYRRPDSIFYGRLPRFR